MNFCKQTQKSGCESQQDHSSTGCESCNTMAATQVMEEEEDGKPIEMFIDSQRHQIVYTNSIQCIESVGNTGLSITRDTVLTRIWRVE